MIKKEHLPVLEGLVLEEEYSLTLRQLCRICTVRSEHILELVEEGIIEPRGAGRGQYRFHTDSLRRVQVSCRLQRDLGVNLAGVALALDLLDEIEQLRNRIGFKTGD
ncbi:MAG: MerR family transcriptional regulator [Deltaproteobacteria bacterium]|nr:MerR family transcriptional regulator [Deltaproteobacteria bacterium]